MLFNGFSVIFIILQNLTFKCQVPNCVLASFNQISEHSQEDQPSPPESELEFLFSSQFKDHYDLFLEIMQ